MKLGPLDTEGLTLTVTVGTVEMEGDALSTALGTLDTEGLSLTDSVGTVEMEGG